jgi:hypothetical protein
MSSCIEEQWIEKFSVPYLIDRRISSDIVEVAVLGSGEGGQEQISAALDTYLLEG